MDLCFKVSVSLPYLCHDMGFILLTLLVTARFWATGLVLVVKCTIFQCTCAEASLKFVFWFNFFFFPHKNKHLYHFSVTFSNVVAYHRAFGITQCIILMFLFVVYTSSLLKYFQVFLVDGFRKSYLSTILLIHKIIWFLFSPIPRILNYHNMTICYHTL